MKSTFFWAITFCSLLEVNRSFGGTSPPSSGSNNKLSKKPAELLSTCFHGGFLLGLFFYPEDESDMFLRNVGWLSMALYPRRDIFSAQKLNGIVMLGPTEKFSFSCTASEIVHGPWNVDTDCWLKIVSDWGRSRWEEIQYLRFLKGMKCLGWFVKLQNLVDIVTRLVTVDGYWIENWIYYNRTLKYNTTESLWTPSVLQLTTHSAVTVSTATALLTSFANTILVAAELQVPFLFPWIPTHSTHSLDTTSLQLLTNQLTVRDIWPLDGW
jgi:hypothetical protein